MKKKKILYIVNVDWFFISHRLQIALAAQKEGYDIHVLTRITTCKNKLELYGFKLHNIYLKRKSEDIFSLIKYFNKIVNNLNKINPDIVHCITIKPILFGGLASIFFPKIKMVYAISGLGHVYSSSGWKAKIRRLVVDNLYKIIFSRRNFKIIFQNKKDREIISNLTSLNSDNNQIIYGSGIDLEKYKPIKEIKKNMPILFASRLLKSKGIIEFISAAKLVNDASFLIAGAFDDDSQDSISKLELKELIKDTRIKFLGEVKNMCELINECSIVVLPSYYGEGLPKILIEAAGCGRPIITTDHPGCRDAININKNGFLVPIKDVKSLEKMIRKLFYNPNLCKKMGTYSRSLALEKYDINLVIKKHLKIYKDFN